MPTSEELNTAEEFGVATCTRRRLIFLKLLLGVNSCCSQAAPLSAQIVASVASRYFHPRLVSKFLQRSAGESDVTPSVVVARDKADGLSAVKNHLVQL
jgi:hypothetical protein